MTELMKRYEAETDEIATWSWHNKEFVTDDVLEWASEKIQALDVENAQLKAQLTWRPVSEKPEKAGIYFAEVRPNIGCESTIITTVYFYGERFLWHNVVRWLPIPPAQEVI